MTAKLILVVLFMLSLAGALVEGLWTAAPPVLVQFNGMLLLLSAIGIGILSVTGGSGPTSAPHSEGS
jgi:hypothetical protein